MIAALTRRAPRKVFSDTACSADETICPKKRQVHVGRTESRLGSAPNEKFVVSSAAFSIAGKKTNANQDAFFLDSNRRVFVLADGIGSLQNAELASQLAVDVLSIEAFRYRHISSNVDKMANSIQSAFLIANERILDAGQQLNEGRALGTTAVMAVVHDDLLYTAGLGDSRAYLVRGHRVKQLTSDDTEQQLRPAKTSAVNAKVSYYRIKRVLTRYLGQPCGFEVPAVKVRRLRDGDRVLLTSDGLTDVIDEARIGEITKTACSPQHLAEMLSHASWAAGTNDDSTCVAVDVNGKLQGRMK